MKYIKLFENKLPYESFIINSYYVANNLNRVIETKADEMGLKIKDIYFMIRTVDNDGRLIGGNITQIPLGSKGTYMDSENIETNSNLIDSAIKEDREPCITVTLVCSYGGEIGSQRLLQQSQFKDFVDFNNKVYQLPNSLNNLNIEGFNVSSEKTGNFLNRQRYEVKLYGYIRMSDYNDMMSNKFKDLNTK